MPKSWVKNYASVKYENNEEKKSETNRMMHEGNVEIYTKWTIRNVHGSGLYIRFIFKLCKL